MTGVERIAHERERQITEEGYSYDHDDKWTDNQLVRAAICFAFPWIKSRLPVGFWPWDPEYFKITDDPIRSLEKAGALLAAEIDRLERLKGKVVLDKKEGE
jgi:hypothetical protein